MLSYDMSQRGSLSRYEYLYRRMRDDILSGAIAAGDRLPSKRGLADALGVSLVTVENAYAQLVAEGYVTALERRGYYANELPVPHGVRPCVAMFVSPDPTDDGEGPRLLADFSSPATLADSSAANLWERALRQTLSQEPREELFAAQPPQGTLRLRRAIARYLRGSRGVDVDPSRIVVAAGAQAIYAMIARLVGSGGTVAVEDPGYPRVWQTYAACGLHVAFVPTDREGMRVGELSRTGSTLVHVMPSHQFPTGCVTSASRRYGLLGWAAEGREVGKGPVRYVVEDDYDCEFRMSGRPIPPLLAPDSSDSVIYVNTFSKSLSSALRLAYMVLPVGLAQAWERDLSFLSCTVSVVDQVALARLLESGDYERHVSRYRSQQRALRDGLVRAMGESPLSGIAHAEERDSGLHFVLALPAGDGGPDAERAVARAALGRGVRLAPLCGYAHDRRNASRGDGLCRFVMQYDGLKADCIPRVVEVLAWAVQSVGVG